MLRSLLALACCVLSCSAAAAERIAVRDDAGGRVQLQRPAQRIVSLAPGLTELIFSIGAGSRLVGVDRFSDYPPAARELPRVGSATHVDFERLLAARPDLVLLWQSGSPQRLIARLRATGIAVYVSEPKHLDDIALTMERLGRLTGHEPAARAAADEFRRRQENLGSEFGRRQPLSVFYQVWGDPLITVNGTQFISEVISLCGGVNVFAGLANSAPRVSVESVLARDPQVMVAGRTSGDDAPLARWRVWPQLRAVRNRHLFYVPADLLQRPSARLLDGARLLCEQMHGIDASKATAHR